MKVIANLVVGVTMYPNPALIFNSISKGFIRMSVQHIKVKMLTSGLIEGLVQI
jgi:hypothetical protein